MNGQITPLSEAGKEIIKIVKRNDIKNIVESGTWEGGGTTLCILSNLKKDQFFISIELYPNIYKKAKENLSKYLYLENFKLLNGALINYEDIFWFDHNIIDKTKNLHAKLWFDKDLKYLKDSKNLINKLPDKIDFLILDGGEYSTYPEWNYLKNRTKVVFLDDTQVLKTNKIRKELLNNKNYKIIKDNPFIRNGYAIFEKIN